MIVQPLFGVIGDRQGHAIASFVAVTLCATGLVGLLAATDIFLITISLVVFALGLSAFWPVTMALGLNNLSTESRAGDWGIITAIFLATEAVGSLYLGIIIDLTSYIVGFTSLLLFLLVTIAITFWIAAFQ